MVDMNVEQLTYASSVDGTQPLFADVAFVPGGGGKPLLVVMHGYSGGRQAVAQDIRELAQRGVVAIAPDMRGKGGSAGRWDSSGLDVHDILDAVLAAVARYPGEIDARNLSIVGYSGGGGNAIACMTRFPDLFQTYVSFFGIADYGGWHRSGGRPDCNEVMEAALGGTPDQLPKLYAARNFIPAAGNARSGRLHFVWDEDETMCPPAMTEAFLRVHREAGLANATIHVSRQGDAPRWTHSYRSGNPDLSAADDLYLADVLAPKAASPVLPTRGRLVVPGYLVTRTFQVWIGDGQGGQVTVIYDLTGATPSLQVIDNPHGYRVRIEVASPLSRLP
jgi:pimeloyl-ACP methyl ester carboxylesterase